MQKKYKPEEKVQAVRQYLAGEGSQKSIAKELGISQSSFQKWIRNYESMGEDIFYMKGFKGYPADIKEQAVADYLSGKGSQNEICKRYKIRSTTQLHRWILKYNGHEKLKSSEAGGSRLMTKGRNTTLDERFSIVEFCIGNNYDYAQTADKYKVSYQQVYTWVRKYEKDGIEALKDRRGRTKPTDEMSEIERLRYENRILKAEKKKQQMEIDFLKKLGEIERRR